MKLGQQMKLAPRMIQSMEILQMPLAELEERIQQELENNPTLELMDGAPEGDAPAPALEARSTGEPDDRPLALTGEPTGDEFERLESYEQDHPDAVENEYAQDLNASDTRDYSDRLEPGEYSAGRLSGERDGKLDAMASAPARGASLADQLRGQWSLCDVEDRLRPLGDLIISFLDEDGYLRTDLETIADRATVDAGADGSPTRAPLTKRPSVADLERALSAVQLLLEPAGVAARTAAECLLLQLDAIGDQDESGWPAHAIENCRRLVSDHLDDITQNRLPRISERTRLTLDEIKEALTLLKRLSLAPGRRLVSESLRPIVPDAVVEYDEAQDRYLAYLNDSRLPNVRINQEYARIAKDRAAEKRDREFIRTNLVNAQWLLDAVGQRRHTLLRVVREVVDAQREFFDYGPQALRPLPMTAVAEKLGIHVATVSRAVSDKYLATPRGVVPLRKFFSGGVTTKSDGEGGAGEMAWDAIKAALKEVVEGEDRAKPLSDEALVEVLKTRGIEIARRTIAKYREQLGIPTARLRRSF